MFSLQSDKITALWPDNISTFTLYVTFSNSLTNWESFLNPVFDFMFSLESDEMTALWPNDSSTFTFYVIISKSISNWATFVKKVFWFGV